MRSQPLTLEELEAWPDTTVTPTQASGVLNVAPFYLNQMAEKKKHIILGSNPVEIYFHFSGRRLHIHKASLLAWCRAESPVAEAPENGA